MVTDAHLTSEQFHRLLQWECTRGEAFEWLFHLMTCAHCQHRLSSGFAGGSALLQKVFRRVGGEDLPRRDLAGDQRARYRRLLERLRRQGTAVLEEREAAPTLLAELADHPRAHRRLLLVNGRRFHRLGLAFAILDKARVLWHEDPQGACRWAEDCLLLIEHLAAEDYDPHMLRDVEGLAWAYRGNSQRILGQVTEAEKAFGHARRCFQAGSDDPSDRASLLSYEASLREIQGHTSRARDLLHQAQAAYRRLGDRRGQARIILQQAFLLHTEGDIDRAVTVLEGLGSLLSGNGGPWPSDSDLGWPEDDLADLRTLAIQNLAVYLADLERYREARCLLPEIRRATRSAGRLARLRVQWLEGRIAAGEGQARRAGKLLELVRQAFIREGLGLETALVTLDLAALHLQTGDRRKARALAAEMLPLFLAQDVEREACATLLVFHRALREDTASEALARQIGVHLRRRRHLKAPPTPPN